MSVFRCKMCGGTLEINENQSTAVCEYCGTPQTLPKLSDEKRANLYDRANHFRRNNEFDKAMSIYEKILNEDSSDAEAYWSLVLCRYGIEYVEDPSTRKRVPTVNRAQFTSIFDDDNYKSALNYADGYQKSIYQEEANAINEIQKGILAISQNEKPFDVFICYKETDANGRRTQDSVLANDLYHQLIQEGFKVFFSRITLEDKLGTAYEPYIFAALNSAKVMVVLGTKPEYFNAVWVKNEWSRYLALVKNSGGKKVLIPAYKDMDPYDLPEEFSHLQAQDMSKLGFMQDLIRGITKLAESKDQKTTTSKETANKEFTLGGNVTTYLERVKLFLQDGLWEKADEYCEKVLDVEPKNPYAYLYKLMAQENVKDINELAAKEISLENNNLFEKAFIFADDNFKAELEQYKTENIYSIAVEKSTQDNIAAKKYAVDHLKNIIDYKDSRERIEQITNDIMAIYNNDLNVSESKINQYEGQIREAQENISRVQNDLNYFNSKAIEESELNKEETEVKLKSAKKKANVAHVIKGIIAPIIIPLIFWGIMEYVESVAIELYVLFMILFAVALIVSFVTLIMQICNTISDNKHSRRRISPKERDCLIRAQEHMNIAADFRYKCMGTSEEIERIKGVLNRCQQELSNEKEVYNSIKSQMQSDEKEFKKLLNNADQHIN